MTGDQARALRAYADRRRADLTATRLGAARRELSTAGLVRNCGRGPMYVEATSAGLQVLAELARPVQLELFS